MLQKYKLHTPSYQKGTCPGFLYAYIQNKALYVSRQQEPYFHCAARIVAEFHGNSQLNARYSGVGDLQGG